MLNLKGYSVVILIIISLAIVLSIFIAIWILGLIENYTRYEEIRISSSTVTSIENYWIIELYIVNTGSRLAVIDTIFINNMPIEKYNNSVVVLTFNGSSFNYDAGYPLEVGRGVVMRLRLAKSVFSSGLTIQIRVKTKCGNEYFKDIKLP